MSYQQPPGYGNGPAGPPAGWYQDPNGFEALRWWDGVQWSPQTRPLPGPRPEFQPLQPDAAGGASDGYGASGQPGVPQDSGAYGQVPVSGPYPASFPPGSPQQADPSQPQGPYQQQGWPQQQPYAPAMQPQAHRAPRRPGNGRARGALIAVGTLAGVIVVIGVATAHTSKSAGNVAATSTTSAGPTASAAAPASAAPAASAPPDCGSQAVSWRDNGGLNQLQAVDTDMGNVSSASAALGADLSAGAQSSQDEGSLQTAAASLQSDAQTAQANLPPSCVPHMRRDYSAALNDASKASIDCQDAVSELGSGNYSVALDDVNAANSAMTASGKKFQAASADVQAFNSGN